MSEQQSTFLADDCGEEDSCRHCPLNELAEPEQTIWRSVVDGAVAAIAERGCEAVRMPWMELGVAARQEVRRGLDPAAAKSLGNVAAVGCLRVRLGRDFQRLRIDDI